MEEYYSKPKKKRFWLIIIILIFIGLFSLFFLKTGFTISQVITGASDILPFNKVLPDLPKNEPNRINILLLGGRGSEELGDGKLLSDAMILASIKKGPESEQVALISIPRDLYVTIYCTQEDRKINFAYAQGGLDCAKKTVSLVTGQYVDYAVDVNFEALVEGIDALGGIEVYLERTFEESFQWAKEGWEEDEHWFIKEIEGEERWVFHVATGTNQLDGQTALYYVRSRYSTDDFDRMRRQSQVLIAIKDKAFSLGVLTNPVKVYNLLDVLGKNIRTDMSLTDIGNLISLVKNIDKDNIKKRFFDITPDGLLYHTFINEEYVLLPIGDNYDKIEEACHNIFD